MKKINKILLGYLLLSGLQFASSGCSDANANGSVYYGPQRDPWFRDDPWMDGHRWYRDEPSPGVGIYIHPPRQYRR